MPGHQFMFYGHTNQLIPVYTKGTGSQILASYADHFDYYRGKYMDNTEIARSVFSMFENLPNIDPDIKKKTLFMTRLRLSTT